MKLSLTLAFGFIVFLLGIPLSLAFPVEALGHSLIVAGAIIIGALVIASEVSSRHVG